MLKNNSFLLLHIILQKLLLMAMIYIFNGYKADYSTNEFKIYKVFFNETTNTVDYDEANFTIKFDSPSMF